MKQLTNAQTEIVLKALSVAMVLLITLGSTLVGIGAETKIHTYSMCGLIVTGIVIPIALYSTIKSNKYLTNEN